MDNNQIEWAHTASFMYLFLLFTINNLFFVFLYSSLNKEIVRITIDYNNIKNKFETLITELSSDSSSGSDSESGNEFSGNYEIVPDGPNSLKWRYTYK